MHRFHKTYLLAAAAAALALVASCSIPTDPEDETVDDGPVVTQTTNITVNTTWSAGSVYIIDGTVNITNATLTIEPGTVVRFKEGASLDVMAGGGLIADGTTDTIVFTGTTQQAGWWDYIWFDDNSVDANCKLIDCIIEYGGGYSANYGMIYCESASPTITGCVIRNAQYTGAELNGTSAPTFKHNTITGCGTPVEANFANAGHVDTCAISGNTNNYIFVNGATLTADAAWAKQPVPYLVKYGDINDATLTIDPGTVIWIDEDGEIDVNAGGGLVAAGTAAERITISAQYAQAGYWDYIWFDDGSVNAECILDYCDVSYGGGYSTNYGMVYCESASPTLTNCTFSHAQYTGVELDNDAFPTFSHNTVSDCGTPIEADFANAGSIDTTVFSNNTNSFIYLNHAYLSSNATWTAQPIPYLVSNGDINNATLTIEPGTSIMLDAGASIDVNGGGALYADGTADSIIFTGRYAQKGYWDYIWFDDACAAVNCMLKNCRIEYGGGYSSNYAMVYCEEVDPNVSGCLIRYSESYGIYAPNDASIQTNNTIVDNDLGAVQP